MPGLVSLSTPSDFTSPLITPQSATMPTSSRTRSLRPILPRSELSILNTPTQIVRPPLPTPESSAVTSASVASPIQVSPGGGSYFFHWRGRKLRMMGPLPWPCDSLELERVEAQHWLLRLLLGFPYIGPVEEVLRAASRDGRQGQVLDIATGVGVWAMDVAELFPSVQVTGCDDVPIQEVETWANVEWDVVDLDDLPYDAESFDVVHIRFAQLRVKSFRHLLRSAWRILRPGGVLLVFDAASPPTRSDTTSPTGCQAWSDAFHKSLHRAGLKPFTVDDIVRVFRDEELIGSDMRVPIGHGEGRMGQLGKIHVVNTRAYLDAGRYVLTEHGGYTDAEVDVLTDAYLADIKNWQLYTRYHAFSVRKGSAHA